MLRGYQVTVYHRALLDLNGPPEHRYVDPDWTAELHVVYKRSMGMGSKVPSMPDCGDPLPKWKGFHTPHEKVRI